MVPKEFLLIAGDADSDRLAAKIVQALRRDLAAIETGYSEEEEQPLHASLEPRFSGAGGPLMAEQGVEMPFDATHLQSIRPKFIRLLRFRRAFAELCRWALQREPHAIIGIGFFGFNLRFAHAIKHYVHHREGTFYNWDPRIIQVSAPQQWTARPRRLERFGKDIDCLFATNPDEGAWYARHAPQLRVEFLDDPKGLGATELAQQAADAISRIVLDEEAHFPLRAYLSHPQSP